MPWLWVARNVAQSQEVHEEPWQVRTNVARHSRLELLFMTAAASDAAVQVPPQAFLPGFRPIVNASPKFMDSTFQQCTCCSSLCRYYYKCLHCNIWIDWAHTPAEQYGFYEDEDGTYVDTDIPASRYAVQRGFICGVSHVDSSCTLSVPLCNPLHASQLR